MFKYLANENVPFDSVQAARAAGYDVNWIAETAQGASDDVVLATASTEHRVLLTCDKDFGEMAFRRGKAAHCGIILLRPQMRSPAHIAQFVVSTLGQAVAWEGHFCVAQEGKLRVVPLP